MILAVLALIAVVLGGWQWWQWRQQRQAGAQAMTRLQQRVTALESGLQRDVASRQQAQQALQASSAAFGQRMTGMSERVDGLEHAVAGLARHSQQGRRAMLLDQAELLLRMGQERYVLFHDAAGALKADTLAGQVLAAVNDPALDEVRHTLAGERAALAALHLSTRAADLTTLAQLRRVIVTLPLKPLRAGPGKAPTGFWQRVWHALSTAVVVRRVGSAARNQTDGQLARQLAALDVAQAEAARLAWDEPAFHVALKRADQALATAFDPDAAGVRKARATLARLLAEPVARTPPDLGKALEQLRNLRTVQGLPSGAAMPAEAASAASSGPSA